MKSLTKMCKRIFFVSNEAKSRRNEIIWANFKYSFGIKVNN